MRRVQPGRFRAPNVSNAFDPAKKSADVTLSNGNLTATGSTTALGTVLAVSPLPVGDWAFAFHCAAAGGTWAGVATSSALLSSYLGSDAFGWGYGFNGTKTHSGDTAYGPSFGDGTELLVLCRVTDGGSGTFNMSLWFSLGGSVIGGGNPTTGTSPAFTATGVSALYPAWSDGGTPLAPVGTYRGTAASIVQTLPSGYSAAG